ncbi:MAG: amino acid adenylation domain-containing protein [Pseudonocardiaceae bacterium]
MVSIDACATDEVSPGWNDTATAYPRDHCLHELFDEQAAARPTAHAAEENDRVLTYGELKSQSDGLAARLQTAGVGRGDLVGLCGTRSLEALVAILGILKAGAAYVPLDDTYPPARLRAMAEDTEINVAVVLPGSSCRIRRLRSRIEFTTTVAEVPGAATVCEANAGDCAYVVFTSGSTGRPKPVAVTHRGVVRIAVSDRSLEPPTPDDRVLHALSLSSDGSTHEIWSALLNGACLVLVDREDLLSPAALEDRLHGMRITFAHLTTSVFHHLARTKPGALSSLRFASAGGEALDAELTRAVLRACPRTTVVNFYGPTENSVVSTAYVVRDIPDDVQSVPIGRPLANSTAYVVRDDGSRAGIGEEGELLVGGDGLALGYLGHPELTAQRFVPNLFEPGSTLYRTGDRVLWRRDGNLEYRGRRDRQIKLRGHRIELDEIEARLRAQPSVGEAIVEVSANGFGDTLVAHVTPAAPGGEVPVAEVRRDLARWLPAQAVPSRLIAVPRFPLTNSGKIDRQRLAAYGAPAPADESAPSTVSDLQQTVAEIWQTTLRVLPSGADSFFDLGGDSMLAAEVITRTLAVLGIDARHGSRLVGSLLRSPTLAEHTEAVRAVRGDQGLATSAAEIDFPVEATLGFRLGEPTGPAPNWSQPQHVLLTGASGFVGAHLLDRLLRSTTATVHCPIRGRDTAHAQQRVLANLSRYGLAPTDATKDRVLCFPADLTADRLGLSDRHFAELAGSVDLIIHSAAEVNFLYPYSALKPSNVDGTRTLIRMAARRRVPMHFLSTIGVVAGFGTAGVRRVDENMPLDHADRLTMGYAESKWVAEKVLHEAAEQGLPIAIYRPYEVTGSQWRGICNTDTAICSLFKVFADMGVAPDVPLPMDFIPADHVASAIVHIATQLEPARRVYHLTNPEPARLTDMIDRMRAAGCEIKLLGYEQWVAELVRYVAQDPTNPAAPFVSLCIDRGHKADISVKEMYFAGVFPELGRDNIERALADSGLQCPPVDATLLDLYLEYFFASGYIARPRR